MLSEDSVDAGGSNQKDNLIRRKKSPEGMNDISIIDRTGNTNVSMNTTGIDLMN